MTLDDLERPKRTLPEKNRCMSVCNSTSVTYGLSYFESNYTDN